MIRNRPMGAPTLAAVALGALIAGVTTGATIAAISSAREVKKGSKTKQEATNDIIREAGTMGLATTIGATSTAALGIGGLLSIVTVALFTAGSKYTIDSLLFPCPKQSKKEIEAKEESIATEEILVPEENIATEETTIEPTLNQTA